MHYCWKYVSYRLFGGRDYRIIKTSPKIFECEESCIEDALNHYPSPPYRHHIVLCVKECVDTSPSKPFATVASRLQTFEMWPPAMPISPKSLAEAGFCYEGIGDKVTCFECKKTLMHWRGGDDPWWEHRRQSPNCPYLQSAFKTDGISHKPSLWSLYENAKFGTRYETDGDIECDGSAGEEAEETQKTDDSKDLIVLS